MFNNKVKGYSSLISSILIQLLIGNILTFPNLIPYYQSYLYYKNNNTEKISALQLYFIAPVGLFVHNAFPSFTGILDKKVRIRILTLFATLFLFISQLIIYFCVDYYLLLISYFFYGLGGSVTYFQTLRNCWQYFPGKKDLISGIVFSCFGLSSFAFTSLADYIINPDNIPKKGNYYSREISFRFLDYIKVSIFCIIILGSISSILSFPFEEEKRINLNNDIDDKKEQNIKENEDENNKEETKEKLIIKKQPTSLKKIILSLEFLKCLLMAGCTLIFGFLLTNTYRNFGIEKKLDENGMHTLSKVFTLLNTFSRLIWGVICEKFKFRIPYLIIVINQIVCGSLIYFASENLITYFIVVCFGVLSFAGHIILFPNLIHTKFGVENSVILLGICGIFGGASSLIGPLLTTFINDLEDYLITYLLGAAPSIVSLILTIIIKIENVENIDDKLITDKIDKDEDNKLFERFSEASEKNEENQN